MGSAPWASTHHQQAVGQQQHQHHHQSVSSERVLRSSRSVSPSTAAAGAAGAAGTAASHWTVDASSSLHSQSAAAEAAVEGEEHATAALHLSMERAVAIHHVWLAHLSGRPLGYQSGWKWEGTGPGRERGDREAGAVSGGAGAEADGGEGMGVLYGQTVRGGGGGSILSRFGGLGRFGGFSGRQLGVGGGGTGRGGRGTSSNHMLRRSYGGEVENLLAMCGSRPAAHLPTDLSWWIARVANPLPPLGAALELRGQCLSATSARERFDVCHRQLAQSMQTVHRLPPASWRGARPLASAVVAGAVCDALDRTAPTWRRQNMAIDEDTTVVPCATEEDFNALVAAVRDILAEAPAPIPGANPGLCDVMALPSEFVLAAAGDGGPTPAMGCPPVPRAPGAFPAPAQMSPAPRRASSVAARGSGPEEVIGSGGCAGVGGAHYAQAQTRVLRSPDEFEAAWSRLVYAGGWAAVCWSLYLQLAQLDEVQHDGACASLAEALTGGGGGGERASGGVIGSRASSQERAAANVIYGASGGRADGGEGKGAEGGGDGTSEPEHHGQPVNGDSTNPPLLTHSPR